MLESVVGECCWRVLLESVVGERKKEREREREREKREVRTFRRERKKKREKTIEETKTSSWWHKERESSSSTIKQQQQQQQNNVPFHPFPHLKVTDTRIFFSWLSSSSPAVSATMLLSTTKLSSRSSIIRAQVTTVEGGRVCV